MNSVLGMTLFALGGLAGATFILPSRGIKGWAYETWWMFYSVFGLLVAPPIIAACTVPNFFSVIFAAKPSTIVACMGFGILWGIGGLTWGLMIRYLGIGLGLAMGCGLCAATGTLIPPIVQGHAADLVKDAAAIQVLCGVIGSLVGIVFVGLAGKIKEGELPEEEKKKAVADFDFKKGMLVALVSGICSAGMNFGLQSGGEIEKAAVAAGAKAIWGGMPVLVVVLWGGFLVQAAWCLQQHSKNATFGDYTRFSPRNAILGASVGLIWVMQFVCQKTGEPLVGADLKYISWAVLMASTILFSTIVAIMTGEWKGTSAKTRGCLTLGLAVLIVSFLVMSFGSR